jgi:hypothetical protein
VRDSQVNLLAEIEEPIDGEGALLDSWWLTPTRHRIGCHTPFHHSILARAAHALQGD